MPADPAVEEISTGESLPREQILDCMTGLLDKSMLACRREVGGETRFSVLESIRQYALEKLRLAQESCAMMRRTGDHWSSGAHDLMGRVSHAQRRFFTGPQLL